jgi:hypothetical protein
MELGRNSTYPLDRRLGGSQSLSGLWRRETVPFLPPPPESNPCRPARSLVPILTELPRLWPFCRPTYPEPGESSPQPHILHRVSQVTTSFRFFDQNFVCSASHHISCDHHNKYLVEEYKFWRSSLCNSILPQLPLS